LSVATYSEESWTGTAFASITLTGIAGGPPPGAVCAPQGSSPYGSTGSSSALTCDSIVHSSVTKLDDAGVVSVVEKMIKQRKDSIAQYEKAARQDLADKEKYEISVIEAYLPKQLSQAEVEAVVAEAIASTGAKSPADMGKVMGVVKPKLAGKADMGKVSAIVKSKLA